MAELHTLRQDQEPPRPTQPPKRKRRLGQAWRAKCATEAGLEVCAIGELLQRDCRDLDDALVRGLAIRLEELGGIVMATADEADDEQSVRYRLLGPAVARAQAAK